MRHRPESLQGYVAQVVLRRLSDAEMGIDLLDRRLSDSDRRFAFPVVGPWVRELIRSLGNRTGPRQVKIGLAARCYCSGLAGASCGKVLRDGRPQPHAAGRIDTPTSCADNESQLV